MASGSGEGRLSLVGGGDRAKTRRIGPEGIFRHAQGRLLNIERANWVQGRQPPEDLTMSQAIPSHRLRRGPAWALAGLTFGGINTHMHAHTHTDTRYSGGHSCPHTHAHTHFQRQTHTCVFLTRHTHECSSGLLVTVFPRKAY